MDKEFIDWLYGPGKSCGICGERFTEVDEIAEMYDPHAEDSIASVVICHAQCGLDKDYEIA